MLEPEFVLGTIFVVISEVGDSNTGIEVHFS